MSKLSEHCKKCMENNGYTVYSLAKNTNLDRTSIHRLVSGKRTPSKEFLLNFCGTLRMNHQEEMEILELFEEEKAGTTVYQNRKHIIRLFREIHLLDVSTELTPKPVSFSLKELPAFTDTLQTTKTQILYLLDLLSDMTSEHETFVLTNIPFTEDFSFNELLNISCLRGNYTVQFKHLITLMSNPNKHGENNYNLTMFARMLPLALSDFQFYIPKYTYSHMSIEDSMHLQWPYYLVSNDFVLEVSADMKRSILHRSPLHLSWFRQELEEIYANSRTLMQIPSAPEETLKLYTQFSGSGSILGVIQSLPWISECIPDELFDEAIKEVKSSKEISHYIKTVRHLYHNAASPHCYFTMTGLIHFIKTGKITGQLYAFFPPLSVENRKKILTAFLGKNEKECHSILLKPKISIIENLYIEILPNQKLIFCIFLEKMNTRFTMFSESSIYEAFLDFFHYLSEPSNSYSPEETNAIVKKLMQEYL